MECHRDLSIRVLTTPYKKYFKLEVFLHPADERIRSYYCGYVCMTQTMADKVMCKWQEAPVNVTFCDHECGCGILGIDTFWDNLAGVTPEFVMEALKDIADWALSVFKNTGV